LKYSGETYNEVLMRRIKEKS